MVVRSACPTPAQLEQLVLGQPSADPVDELEAHVAGCRHCADRLARLPAIDPLVAALRGAPPNAPPCPELATRSAALKRLPVVDTVTHVERDTSPPAGVPTASAPDLDRLETLGPFRVIRQLGAGGMGVVLLAEDTRLKRQVAVKVIRPELLGRADMKGRFLREAEAIAAVEHENIVPIHEVNEHAGIPYLVMPYLRGRSLETRLREQPGPLPVAEVVRLGRQIAAGVAAAHRRGLIHRDIKPGNVFLVAGDSPGRPEAVRLLDFGLAAALHADEATTTEGGTVIVGTPGYMAPEQASGGPIDGRADLFSLGCVLYRMAAGRAPFEGGTLIDLLYQTATAEPEPVGRANRQVPAELVRLIGRLLAKQPADRPASADEVASILAKMEAGRGLTRRTLLLAGGGVIGAAGLAVWLLREPPPAPGAVTLELDEPATALLLVHGDEERRLELTGRWTEPLAPGDYLLRLPDPNELRRLVPERFVVQPGKPETVRLRLVGEVRRSADHSGPVYAVAAGGKGVVTAGSDRRIGLWDHSAGKATFLDGAGAPVRAVAVTADGRLAASGGGGRGRLNDLAIRIWDVAGRAEKAKLAGHASWTLALAFTADGRRLISGGRDGDIVVWQTDRDDPVRQMQANNGDGVYGLALAADETRLYAAGGDGKVTVWAFPAGERLDVLSGHSGAVRSVAVLPAGGLVSAGEDGSVRLWDVKAKTARSLLGHSGAVAQAVATPDGRRVVSAGGDGTVRVWDVESGQETWRFTGHRGAVLGVAVVDQGRQAVSCGQDGTVRLWELPR